MLTKRRKVNTHYMIKAKIKKADANVAVKDYNIKTWHKRFGHISGKGLETLVRKRLLPSLVGIALKTCIHYLAEKTHGVAFKSFSLFRKLQILNLIHINICMMQSRSIRGVLYLVTFIDDCFRKV